MTDQPGPPQGPQWDPQHQQWSGPPPGGQYQNYPPQGPPPKKKRKKWPFIVGAVILLIIIISVASNSGGGNTTVSAGGGPTTTANTGPAFQGKQSGDTAAKAGETVTQDAVAITTTPLVDTPAPYSGGKTSLCTTVTIKNGSSKAVSFNTFDWKMQDPSGTARNSSFGGSNHQLNSGQVAPGGTTNGDICFDSTAATPAPGQYVVLLDKAFSLSTKRIGWITTL